MATPTPPQTEPAQPVIPPDQHGKRCRLKNETRSHLAFVTKQHAGELAGYFDLLIFVLENGACASGILQTVHWDELAAMEV